MLTKKDYQTALDVQNACNLSGVIHSWDNIVSRIWEQANAEGEGTDWVNRHPINVLFSDKVAQLTGSHGDENFHQAYEYCVDKAHEG